MDMFCTYMISRSKARQAYLVDVDTARPQLAMANGPILLARHSLVLHCGLFLLSLLGWGLLNWYEY